MKSPARDFSEVEAPVAAAAKRLRRDGAPVAVVTKTLTRSHLATLVNEKLCAIHVRGYFDARRARAAARVLAGAGKAERWVVGGRETDTEFSIGIPRQLAASSKRAARRYREAAAEANRLVRTAFAPALSPLDRLRLELDEQWAHGARLARFEGGAGLAGLVRTILPSTLLEGAAGTLGIVHMDDHDRKANQEHRLSAILYLSVPPSGGELRVWDVATDPRNHENLLYRLISGFGFDPGAQGLIHSVLPRPHVIRPKPGDLVLLDTGRPHAVAGFTRGRRMALQSWVIAAGSDRPLTIYA